MKYQLFASETEATAHYVAISSSVHALLSQAQSLYGSVLNYVVIKPHPDNKRGAKSRARN